MKPHIHARISAKQHGGVAQDYMRIHEFIDHSKSALADVRHRAMLHSAWGIYVVSQVFGDLITNSDGKEVSVRDIAEEHVVQDLGFIPTMEDWLKEMPIQGWMSGTRKTRQVMTFEPTRTDLYID
jgi:hypothetical protein